MSELVPPPAKEEYDSEAFQQLVDFVINLNNNTYKRNTNMEIAGDTDSGGRSLQLILVNPSDLVLTSPNGTRYALRVDDAGVLSTTAV